MQHKLVFALSLAKKAGALCMGFDAVKVNVIKGKAYLVMYTVDMSEKNKLRIDRFCEDLTEVYETELTKDDLLSITKKSTGVFAVTDIELAKLCKNALQNTNKIQTLPTKEERE